MKGQTVRSVKVEMALGAWQGGFPKLVIVGAGLRLVAVAGPAGGALTGMVFSVVGVKATVTLGAPITTVGKSRNGGTPLIMMLTLEQYDGMRGVRSTENQEKRMLAAEDLELIVGGEVALKLCQLWESAGSFAHPRRLMEFSGHGFLSGSSQTECIPITSGHAARVIAMAMGTHGHNGPGTAQFILVRYPDDGLFLFTVFVESSLSHIVLARTTARVGHSHQHYVNLKATVGVEIFVRIEFARQSIQQLIEVGSAIREILHLNIGGTKRMGKAMRVDGEVEEIVGVGFVGVVDNLSSDRPIQGLH